jgi:phosphoserine phosphatase RsbU/P
MSIRLSALLVVFFLNLLTTGVMVVASYQDRIYALEIYVRGLLSDAANEAIEEARAAPALNSLPTDTGLLHDDQAQEQLRQKFEKLVQRKGQEANPVRISGIYTLAKRGEKIFFTSNYYDPKADPDKDTPHAHVGTEYTGYERKLLNAFKEQGPEKVSIPEYKDGYGTWNSLFVPFTLSNGERQVIGVDISGKELKDAYAQSTGQIVAIGLFTLLLSMSLGLLLVNWLLQRVESLVKATRCTVQLGFKPDAKILARLTSLSTQSKDEIAVLSDAILSLLRDLDGHIQKLTKVGGELQAAKDIQTSLLPKIVPPLASCPEFGIHADVKPAREVGGDLYSCFWTDEDHLFFAVGDVSDKGVSAALIMTATMALLKTEVIPGRPLSEAIGHINALLSENNEQMNFVTLFCCVLDVRTGELECCNAGHLLPCLLPHDSPPRMLDMAKNPALGIYPDHPFISGSVTLRPDDRVFLYTDGVTEAMNVSHEQFSEGRLLSTLEGNRGTERELLDTVLESVRGFAGDAPQSDDIAMLVLRYRGDQAEQSARKMLLGNPRIWRNVHARQHHRLTALRANVSD